MRAQVAMTSSFSRSVRPKWPKVTNPLDNAGSGATGGMSSGGAYASGMRGSRTRRSLNNASAPVGRQGIVGEECVHGGQPGAVAVAQQICDLHGRGPPRERQQPVAGTVARQIDQNIDPVARISSASFASHKPIVLRQ